MEDDSEVCRPGAVGRIYCLKLNRCLELVMVRERGELEAGY